MTNWTIEGHPRHSYFEVILATCVPYIHWAMSWFEPSPWKIFSTSINSVIGNIANLTCSFNQTLQFIRLLTSAPRHSATSASNGLDTSCHNFPNMPKLRSRTINLASLNLHLWLNNVALRSKPFHRTLCGFHFNTSANFASREAFNRRSRLKAPSLSAFSTQTRHTPSSFSVKATSV